MARIAQEDLKDSIAQALQFISHHHPVDFVRALRRAWLAETHPPARAAIEQLLINSRLSARGQRPLCQDTGVAQVFLRVGCGVQFFRRDAAPARSLQAVGRRRRSFRLHRPAQPAARDHDQRPAGPAAQHRRQHAGGRLHRDRRR
jgi:fumarate hydratase class I